MARDKYFMLPLALSPTHAAHALGCRPELIYAAVKAGKIPVYKPSGNKRKILTCDLIEYIRENWERRSTEMPKRSNHEI